MEAFVSVGSWGKMVAGAPVRSTPITVIAFSHYNSS
jgi:hypothetical protein